MDSTDRLANAIRDLEVEAARLASDGSEPALRTLRILRTHIARLNAHASAADSHEPRA